MAKKINNAVDRELKESIRDGHNMITNALSADAEVMILTRDKEGMSDIAISGELPTLVVAAVQHALIAGSEEHNKAMANLISLAFKNHADEQTLKAAAN